MRLFEISPQLGSCRLIKIGFRRLVLYISPERRDCIEVWSLHSLIPNSWRLVAHFPLIELLYATYAVSQTQPFVYALVVALFDCDVPRISILQIHLERGDVKVFDLDEASGNEFENRVFLENVVIGCGETQQLYMFDRSVVMGAVPFWRLTLLEDSMTFVLTSETISAAEEETKCSRFPVLLDGDSRKLLKVCDNRDVLVYDGLTDSWNMYLACSDSHIDLSDASSRGVSETYGRSGHRLGAMESPLNIFCEGGICVAKVFRNGVHKFYSVEFDDENRTYRVLRSSLCRLPLDVQQRFYPAFSSSQFAFVTSKGIAFVPLQPSSLRELSFLCIQREHCTLNAGRWSGGISEQSVKDLCSCKSLRAIV